MATDETNSELPTVLEGHISSRKVKRLRELSLIPNSGKMTKGASLPDLFRDRPSSPLPPSSMCRLAVPCSLGPSRSFHPTASNPLDIRKAASSPTALSPVITRRRTRASSESNKSEWLSPVLANTVLSPVQIRKDLGLRTNSCPTSPRLSPNTSGQQFTKSRPATPCILSSSPSAHTPGNNDRLPRITHSPRLLRPLSPIRMPLDSMRGLFNISPVLRARASDSDCEDSGDSCCDLQEKVELFLQSMTLEGGKTNLLE